MKEIHKNIHSAVVKKRIKDIFLFLVFVISQVLLNF